MSSKLTADVLPSVQELALQFYTSECHPFLPLGIQVISLFVRYPDPPLWNSPFFLVSNFVSTGLFLRSHSLTVILMQIHPQVVSFTLILSSLKQLTADSSLFSSSSLLTYESLIILFNGFSSTMLQVIKVGPISQVFLDNSYFSY